MSFLILFVEGSGCSLKPSQTPSSFRNMFFGSVHLGIGALLVAGTLAGDDKWLSPVYKNFYEFPVPVPPVKKPKA